MARQATREISYAHSAQTRTGRGLIRMMENLTGRPRLIRRAAGYEREVAGGGDFWAVMARRYGLRLDIAGGDLADIPASGPLILVANHPYGILDGLVMGQILAHVRGDFRIMAHKVFCKAEDLDRVILPIDFDESKAAQRVNIETRRLALAHLGQGGAIGIFPGGTVSTAARPFASAMDPRWRGFTARMIAKSGATVVPVYFDGQNSRLFQLASHLHATLRLGLLIREFRARVDAPVRIVIGRPIPAAQLQALAGEPKAMMDFLRKATYELSPRPLKSYGYGFDFDEKHKV